jgi:hypothetical protein
MARLNVYGIGCWFAFLFILSGCDGGGPLAELAEHSTPYGFFAFVDDAWVALDGASEVSFEPDVEFAFGTSEEEPEIITLTQLDWPISQSPTSKACLTAVYTNIQEEIGSRSYPGLVHSERKARSITMKQERDDNYQMFYWLKPQETLKPGYYRFGSGPAFWIRKEEHLDGAIQQIRTLMENSESVKAGVWALELLPIHNEQVVRDLFESIPNNMKVAVQDAYGAKDWEQGIAIATECRDTFGCGNEEQYASCLDLLAEGLFDLADPQIAVVRSTGQSWYRQGKEVTLEQAIDICESVTGDDAYWVLPSTQEIHGLESVLARISEKWQEELGVRNHTVPVPWSKVSIWNATGSATMSSRDNDLLAEAGPSLDSMTLYALAVPIRLNELRQDTRVGGVPALLWGASLGHLPLVEKMLELGASPDVAATVSAVTLAVANAHLDVVETLIAAKADVNKVVGAQSLAPIDAAVIKNDIEMIDRLLAAGARFEFRACVTRPDSTRRPAGFESALHEVVRSGNAELIEALLDRGLDPNTVRDDLENSLIREAAETYDQKRTEEVKLAQSRIVMALIKAGADLERRTKRSATTDRSVLEQERHWSFSKEELQEALLTGQGIE